MEKTVQVYLDDIAEALDRIERYVSDLTFDQFVKDDMTQDAVLRNLEVIGEAANRLPTSFTERYPEFPVADAVAMRNFLIHDYSSVDLSIVWKTIEQDLPEIKQHLSKKD